MYEKWLMTSGYIPRNASPFEVYLNNPKEEKDHLIKVDIYVPDVAIHDKESQAEFYRARNVRGWAKDPSGYYTTGWGLSLTTDEFARIGLLCLNNGVCNGERIVSEAYIKQMSTEREKTTVICGGFIIRMKNQNY